MLIRKALHIISIIVLFCGITNLNSYSQNQQERDSLNIELSKAKHDTLRITINLEIGKMYMFSKPDTALYIYNKALQLSDSYMKKLESDSLTNSIYYYYKLLKAEALNKIGALHYFQHNFNKSNDYFKKSLKVYKEINVPLDLLIAKESKLGIGNSYNNLALIYSEEEDYEQAIIYYNKSLHIFKELKDMRRIAYCYNNLGNVYNILGDYENALDHYQKTLEILEEEIDVFLLFGVLTNTARVNSRLKNYNKALYYANKSLEMAKNNGGLHDKSYSHYALSEAYEGLNNSEKALKYYKLYSETNDSLLNNEKNQVVIEMETKYETEAKEKEIEILNKEKDLQNAKLIVIKERETKRTIQRNFMIVGFIFMLLIALLIFSSYRVKKKSNVLLTEQKIQIEEKNHDLEMQNEEIIAQRNEIEAQRDDLTTQKEKILKQNSELENHKLHLEELIKERTIDLEASKIKAEESDRLKTAFLANISHEIRTPMNAIVGFSNFIIKQNISEEQKNKYKNYIRQSSNALLNLINQIIDISQIESGQLYLSFSDCDVNEILIEVNDVFDEISKEKSKDKVELRYKPDLKYLNIVINTDIMRFKQVVSNLIENSLKYTEEGYVEFGYKVINKEFLQFYIKDTGIGIEDEKIKVIFDRFRQADDEVRIKYGGVGLGLTISKNVIELLGGEIWVESIKDQGAIFYFTLPYKEGLLLKQDDFYKFIKSNKYNWENKLILIAEDNKLNFEYIRESVIEFNANVLWAKDGGEAIELCKNNSDIDLVLMDIKMPVMDGYQATIEIKRLRKDLPIIAQTAYAMPEEIEKFKHVGFEKYITKPIDIDYLLSEIDKIFNRK